MTARDAAGNIATATLTVPFLPVPTCSNVTTKGKAGAAKRGKTITLGTARVKIPKNARGPLTLKLGRGARARLRRARTLKATLTIVATATDGTKDTMSAKLTVRRRGRSG